MNFKHLNNLALHEETKKLVQEERRITVEVIRHLREVEDSRLYSERGHSSLLAYCVQELGYSESSAMRRIAAVRVSREVPEVEEKIKQGVLTLSNVALSQIFFKAEERETQKKVTVEAKREILESLENHSTRQAEKKLFELRPELALTVSSKEERRISAKLTKIEIVLTDEDLEEIKKLKSLMSHINPSMSHKQLYMELVRRQLKKLDPAQKRNLSQNGLRPKVERDSKRDKTEGSQQRVAKPAPVVEIGHEESQLVPQEEGSLARDLKRRDERSLASEIKTQASAETGTKPLRPRGEAKSPKPAFQMYFPTRYIPSTVKQEVWMRDGGVCSYIDPLTGRKCGSRHRLQYDHEIPVARGGASTFENMRLLCQPHNLLVATQIFGERKMREFRTKEGDS